MRLQTLSAWLFPIVAVAARADTLQTHEEYEPLPLEESIKEFGLEKYVDELPPLDELWKRDPNVRCRAAVCLPFFFSLTIKEIFWVRWLPLLTLVSVQRPSPRTRDPSPAP